VDVYPVVNELARLVSYSFSFSTSGTRYRISSQPEPQLISLLVVAVKLCYPFDSLIRFPRSLAEPAALRINWEEWAVIQQNDRSHSDKRSREGKEMETAEHDVFDMSGLQMDEYLSWYETTWLDEEARGDDRKAVPKQLLDMFPTSGSRDPTRSNASSPSEGGEARGDGNATLDPVKQVQRSMKASRVVWDSDRDGHAEHVRRPGSYYKRYRVVEDMPPGARTFFEAAARVVGLSLRSIVDAVYRTESKLEAWKLAKRKLDAMSAQEGIDGPSAG